jgi:hypothetical protein
MSFSKRTITPAAEHEAANERIAVTCIAESGCISVAGNNE